MLDSQYYLGELVFFAQRQKLSRAANHVNRECGLTALIGGGSGELLGIVVIYQLFSVFGQPDKYRNGKRQATDNKTERRNHSYYECGTA
jgi:hypothetical protein